MKSRKVLIFWCALLGLIVFMTAFAGIISPYGPNEMDMNNIYGVPSEGHLLGTDHLGRDVFSRLLEGGKVTLTVASVSVLMALIIGLTGWLVTARIVRSEFLRLKESEFVQMATMFGTPMWKIMTGHLLRNSVPAIFVVTLFNFAGAIFIEVSLSFLGIGIPPAIPSWGNMLYYAQNDILIGAWWIGLFPGIMIFTTILAINFIGEGLKNPQRR